MGCDMNPGIKNSSILPKMWNLTKIILAVVLIVYVLSQLDLAQLPGLSKRIALPWLFLDLVLFIVMTLIKARQYYVLIDREAPYNSVFKNVILQNIVSNFVATSAGIASYFTLMKIDEGVKLRKSVASFLITKIGDLVVTFLLLGVSAAFVWDQISGLRGVTVVFLLLVLLLIGFFLMTVLFRQRFVKLVATVVEYSRLSRISFIPKGIDVLRSLADQETLYILRIFGVSIVYSFLYMGVTLIWVYCNLRVFSLVQPLLVVAFCNSVLQLISWLPVQAFGGLGMTETVLVYMFSQFGVPQAEMALVSIGGRLLSYFLNLVIFLYIPLNTLLVRKRTPK